MGRHAKPPALKLVTGNPGRRTIKRGAPSKLALGNAPPPDHLTVEAGEIWRDTLALLVADRTLATVDLPTLARYCEAVATEREATLKIAEDGPIISGNQGTYPSPWFKIRTDAATRATKAAAILGIGALNRQRLSPMGSGDDADSLDAFQKKYG